MHVGCVIVTGRRGIGVWVWTCLLFCCLCLIGLCWVGFGGCLVDAWLFSCGTLMLFVCWLFGSVVLLCALLGLFLMINRVG